MLHKAKPAERRSSLLDAAREGRFRQGKAQNFVDPGRTGEIVGAYYAFKDVDRYVDTAEPVGGMSVELVS